MGESEQRTEEGVSSVVEIQSEIRNISRELDVLQTEMMEALEKRRMEEITKKLKQ